MADAPLLLRRAGTPKPVVPPEPPVLVPVAHDGLRAGDRVVEAAGSEKISTSTLPIHTVLPKFQFR